MNSRFVDPDELRAADAFVRGLARSLLFDADRAEDVAQDAWLAALRAREAPRVGWRAWLTGAARHLASKTVRGEARRARREAIAGGGDRRPGDVPSAAEILEREAARRALVDAVLSLPEPVRAPLLLRYFEELPPRAIARRLGEPVETIRTRIKRGLALLRERLDDERGGRASWAFLLVPFAGRAAVRAALAGGLAKGVLAVSVKAKVLAAASFVLLASAVAWWISPRPADSTRSTANVADAAGPRAPWTASGSAPAVDSRPAGTAPAPVIPKAFHEPESAPAPSAAQAAGSLVITAVWEKNSAPAPGVPLGIIPHLQPNPFARRIDEVTAADGRLRLDGLRPAEYTIRGGFGGTARANVEPGKTVDVRLEIPRGATVKGVVVDVADRPVSGAQVWVWDALSGPEGQACARTASDGSFEIASVEMSSWTRVGARARGFTPSLATILSEAAGATREVRLRLGPPGGELAVVVTADGKPVRRAMVFAGSTWNEQVALPDGGNGSTAPAVFGFTDERGTLRFDGLAIGKLPLTVRADGLGPWSGEAEISGDVLARVEVVLQVGARIRGTVRDDRGAPVGGARVSIGNDDTLPGASTRAGADGTFEIDDVKAGVIAIGAYDDHLGNATTSFDTVPGQEIRWDPVLKRGHVLTIKVVDERGKPIEGAGIQAIGRGTADGEFRYVSTGVDGRAQVVDCREGPYDLAVHLPGGGSHAAVELSDAHPGPDDVVVTVPDAARPSGYITGLVLRPDGSPAGGVTVMDARVGEHAAMIHKTDLDTGRFKIGPLPPGGYVIMVEAPDLANAQLPAIELERGETRDVGTIQLKAK